MQSKSKANRIITLVIIIILAALFTFPLYWIITGSFKTAKEVNSVTPVWWPNEWTLKNYQTLMSKLKTLIIVKTKVIIEVFISFHFCVEGIVHLTKSSNHKTPPYSIYFLAGRPRLGDSTFSSEFSGTFSVSCEETFCACISFSIIACISANCLSFSAS